MYGDITMCVSGLPSRANCVSTNCSAILETREKDGESCGVSCSCCVRGDCTLAMVSKYGREFHGCVTISLKEKDGKSKFE